MVALAAAIPAVKGNFAGGTVTIGTNNSGIGAGTYVNGRRPTVVPGLNAALFNPASFSDFLSALESTNTSVNASTTVSTTSFGGFAEPGTTLEMTPHIAPGDYLSLEYRRGVSSFTGSSSAAGVPPPKHSDAITSFGSLPDGSTVVLGGLRSSNNSGSVAKVPGLGEIPIFIPKTGNFSVHGDTGMSADVRALLQDGLAMLGRSQSGRIDELAMTTRGLMAVAELERPRWKRVEKYLGTLAQRVVAELTGQGLQKPEVVKISPITNNSSITTQPPGGGRRGGGPIRGNAGRFAAA